MKKRAKGKKKLNNAGLTLVEILVAMAILTAAIIPIMYGYIYSVKNNNRAKDMQQTSVIAHTMIENCKAYDVETIDEMVRNGAFMPDALDSIVDTANAPANGYLYYFDDVTVYSDGTNRSAQVYDLSMKITPIYGESDLMHYEDMSPYNDAIFIGDATLSTGSPAVTMESLQAVAYESALQQLQDLIKLDSLNSPANTTGTAVQMSLGDIDTNLKPGGRNDGLLRLTRVMELDIQKAGDLETATVKCGYRFETNGSFQYDIPDELGNLTTVSVNCTNQLTPYAGRTFEIYSNANDTADAMLENVYMFYTPSYNNVGIPFNDDVIKLESQLGRDVNLYILKQKKIGMEDAELTLAEAAYNPTFETSLTGDDGFVIYHNLNENLGDLVALVAWAEPIHPSLEFKDSFVTPDSKQLMYKVEVGVYDKKSYADDGVTKGMTTETLTTMDGTFLNW